VANCAGTVVELVRERLEEAALAEARVLGPVELLREESTYARLATRSRQRGHDDPLREALDGFVEHGELERLLRLEMSEEAALREIQAGGEDAQRDLFEAELAGQLERLADDGFPRRVPLPRPGVGLDHHDHKKARPVVIVK